MDEELKLCLHHLGNELQMVLGYIEIDQCEKAKPHLKLSLKFMLQLRKILNKK